MRVLYFGTSDFAVPTLCALAGRPGIDVVAVITQPDRPQGRGRRVAESPVKHAATILGLPVLQPERVRNAEFLEQARSLAPDVLVLASFGQLIPRVLLDLPPLGPINVHASLLPAYRGAAPIHYAILNGETVAGVTTMWMDTKLDTGDILLTRQVPVEPDEDTGALTARLAEAGAVLLLETLSRLAAGDCPCTAQDERLATYAPAITPEDAVLRWLEPAARCRDRIRAMSPRPGAVASFRGKRLKVWSSAAVEGCGEPGTVLSVGRSGVDVATGIGSLRLVEVQAENSRRMAAVDWARGARVTPGDRFEVAP